MDIDNLKEILSTIDDKLSLTPSIQLIEEIQTTTKSETVYSHLILREKHFILIQNIIETKNELLVKIVFQLLQKFCTDESNCNLCSVKEKSQFILNILRFLQHTHIEHDLIILEILKFPLNNHETIEPLLNSKIIQSTLEIAINGWDYTNHLIQQSSKALIIKYISIVCIQISHEIKLNEDNFNSYLVDIFSCLLNVFNQDLKAPELRALILECIELLLNNLLIESTKLNGYKIASNKLFLEFAWQYFCPSILCQFGESGISASKSLNNAQTIFFKTIYNILIQLTGLVGGDKSMIPVFEAIYQRVLFYPPEQDRHLLLKLFKTFITKDFVYSLVFVTELDNEAKQTDFTLISLFIGFYRNCYEKSVKEPQDKMLKFLSVECVSSFVEIINHLYKKTPQSDLKPAIKYTQKSKLKKIDGINEQAEQFYTQFIGWFVGNKENITDLDYEIKKFCLNLNSELVYLSSNQYYATVYFLLHDLFKTENYFNDLNENREYFIQRLIKYNCSNHKNEFKLWLNAVYDLNQQYKLKIEVKNEQLNYQLNFISKQIESCFNYTLLFKPSNLSKIVKIEQETKDCREIDLIKNLLKCSWIYLMDVLTGFMLNSQLVQLEQTLFFDSLDPAVQKQLLQNENLSTDLSFELVALKSCLDCLYQIISIISKFQAMEKELSQLMFLLEESCFMKNNFNSDYEISLNQLICLDFLFYATSQMVCNLNSPLRFDYFHLVNYQILWNNLLENYFFCLNLRFSCQSLDEIEDEPENLFEKTFKRLKQKKTSSTHSTTKSVDYESLDSVKMSHQQEIIIQNLFCFLTQESTTIKKVLSKHDLIELIVQKMDFYLNDKLFKFIDLYLSDKQDYLADMFNYLWVYSAQLCQFSKRFLTTKIGTINHEYSTFNNLIIDKLDDLCIKIIEKFNHSVSSIPDAPLPPLSTRNDQAFSFKPFSLYSIFITESWLNIFLDYFIDVCNQLNKEYLLDLVDEYSLIDLSICKKLINLIQKSFETYLNITSSRTFITLNSLDSMRSVSQSSLSSESSASNFNEIDSLILDYETSSLLSKLNFTDSNKQLMPKTTRLLMESTTSVLVNQNENDSFRQMCSIDECCHLNNLFFLPFKYLMHKNKSLDSYLQDTILVSICELVETYSIRIKSSWEILFSCLNKVNLNNKKFRKKLSVSSSASSSYSSLSSLSSNSSTCSSVSFKFDSFRLRSSSLIDIFNIYLSLASNSASILTQGSFDFIKCLSNYLQYSPEIKIDLKKPELNELLVTDLNEEEDERFNMITSDYEHLCDLCHSNQTNTMIRPFLNCFDKLFSILTTMTNIKAVFKIDSSFKVANIQPDFKQYLALNDKQNLFKLYCYLIDSISVRICLSFDELNCVQLGLYLDSLLIRLIDLKQFTVVAYCLLELVLKNLSAQIDFIEFKVENNLKETKTKLVNEKLIKNVLFLSHFMQKRIESFAILLRRIIGQTADDLTNSFIRDNLTKFFSLVSKCLTLKLKKFDSVVQLSLNEPFKDLFSICFKLNDSLITLKCIESIELWHSISQKQFSTIIQHYKQDDLYLNLDVLTNDQLPTPWRFYNIKQAFTTARKILFYKIRPDDNNNDIEQQNDEKNFYRDITLKFRTGNIFAEDAGLKVNLTSFIIAYEFHLSLIDLITAVSIKNATILGLLNQSYLISLKMDCNLSFKILITKLFYSNHDNCLANFVHLTKSSSLCLISNCNQFNLIDDIDDLEIKMEESINETEDYFVYFLHHLSTYYYDLNERAHNFKLERSYIENFLTIKDISPELKASQLVKMHQEHNKALMLSLTNDNNNCNEIVFKNSDIQDFKNRYQVWSIEIISSLLINLNSLDLNCLNQKLLLAVANLIEVFNSCSVYCECLAFEQTEINQNARKESVALMAKIFQINDFNKELCEPSADNEL